MHILARCALFNIITSRLCGFVPPEEDNIPTACNVINVNAGTPSSLAYTVELQCLEHLWKHKSMFETG